MSRDIKKNKKENTLFPMLYYSHLGTLSLVIFLFIFKTHHCLSVHDGVLTDSTQYLCREIFKTTSTSTVGKMQGQNTGETCFAKESTITRQSLNAIIIPAMLRDNQRVAKSVDVGVINHRLYNLVESYNLGDASRFLDELRLHKTVSPLIKQLFFFIVFYQLIQGLYDIHQERIVHHNIRPNNILLSFSQGIIGVHYADFEYAEVIKGQSSRSLKGYWNTISPSKHYFSKYCEEIDESSTLPKILFFPRKIFLYRKNTLSLLSPSDWGLYDLEKGEALAQDNSEENKEKIIQLFNFNGRACERCKDALHQWFGGRKNLPHSCVSCLKAFDSNSLTCQDPIHKDDAYDAFASDLWSLGSTIFKLCTGEYPTRNAQILFTRNDTLKKIKKMKFPINKEKFFVYKGKRYYLSSEIPYVATPDDGEGATTFLPPFRNFSKTKWGDSVCDMPSNEAKLKPFGEIFGGLLLYSRQQKKIEVVAAELLENIKKLHNYIKNLAYVGPNAKGKEGMGGMDTERESGTSVEEVMKSFRAWVYATPDSYYSEEAFYIGGESIEPNVEEWRVRVEKKIGLVPEPINHVDYDEFWNAALSELDKDQQEKLREEKRVGDVSYFDQWRELKWKVAQFLKKENEKKVKTDEKDE